MYYDRHLKGRCGIEQRCAYIAARTYNGIGFKVTYDLLALLLAFSKCHEGLDHTKRRFHGERLRANILKLITGLRNELSLKTFLTSRKDDLASFTGAVMSHQRISYRYGGIDVS